MSGKPKAKIWDLDGTLVDVRGIRFLIDAESCDSFHRASETCPPNADVVEAARRSHDEGFVNLVLSGRREKYRALSERWLAAHAVPYETLLMRANGDGRKDFVIKRELFEGASTVFDIVHATDDRPEVVALWKTLGIPVTEVPGWE